MRRSALHITATALGGVGRYVSAIFYDLFMVPLETATLRRARFRLLAHARGDVLEIGAGTGVNAPHYRPRRVRHLTVTDRDERRRVLERRMLRRHPSLTGRITTARADAHRLPFPDGSFDTVVATLLFCSVDCQPCGFDEIIRVLRPGGRYLFIEHVRPAAPRMARLFDLLNPYWNRLSRGCNVNRATVATMQDAGFSVVRHDAGKHGVFVWGVARRHAEDRTSPGGHGADRHDMVEA